MPKSQDEHPVPPVSRGGEPRARTAARPRMTQPQRSEAMRQRLIKATLECMARDGYAGTTISKIVARAKVSHGATGHHFQTKSDLILAAAEDLMSRSFHLLGDLVATVHDEDLYASVINAMWAKLHSRPEMKAMLALAVAAQTDKPLAKAMMALTDRTDAIYEQMTGLLFEPLEGATVSPHELFTLARSLMFGLAAEYHISGDETAVREQIDAWVRLVGTQVRARRNAAPAKPGKRS